MPRMCNWLVTFASQNTTSLTSWWQREKGTEIENLGENDDDGLSKLSEDNNQSRLSSFFSPTSRSSDFVLVSKLPKVLSNPQYMKSAHPFCWQHTLHTDKSKITSKSGFTFQTWRIYCNQHPTRRRVRLLNYNQTLEFLGRLLVSHIQELSAAVVWTLTANTPNCSQSDTATW